MISNSYNEVCFEIRSILGQKLHHSFSGKIQSGPFKGCLIPKFSDWSGDTDLGSKIIGTYEQDVLNFLQKSKGSYKFLIDIGAADGYYVVGSVFGNIVDRSYGFEINEKDRNIMLENARINNLLDSIYIDSEANLNNVQEILKKESGNSGIFIIDIEGEEFNLLTDKFLEMCKSHTFIVEIHKWADLKNRYESIINYSSSIFDISYVYNRTKTIPDLPLLDQINDNFKWILCSESRPVQQEWLILTPKSVTA